MIPLLLPEKVVLLRMADYADHDGGSIFPAVSAVSGRATEEGTI
jgi:hypothetical protein